ncbi:MAG: DSD1 family PLP-dependent enzyme [Candidatus Sumerlaeia bacterium]|nr:DSD1 family PLP-dependent enzyme [Candidatus Sumerlaeia bacterium]
MLQAPPAVPGMSESEIDTPALLIDLDALEANLDTMAAILAPTGVRLRAHAKTHKSPVIAHLQAARGAIGQCVQKVAEAEVLAWGGVRDILVSNEVVGASKLARLAALARIATISVCVDADEQVAALEAAAAGARVTLTVLVEIDAGGARCGVAPGTAAVALARRVVASPHLRFGGIQAYHGSAQHLRTVAERRAAIAHASASAEQTVALLREAGIACPVVAGGGTGTFACEMASGIYNEIQAGSYIFMDADYGRNLDESGAPVSMFRQSLFVLATVMSAARPGVAVLDAGHKALAVDSGLPLVWQHPEWQYIDASDEHGKLAFDPNTQGPALGSKLRLVPGHCDPTVDRYDWYVGVRSGRVECLWPVAARGALT